MSTNPENWRSTGTEVAGIAKMSIAMFERLGKSFLFDYYNVTNTILFVLRLLDNLYAGIAYLPPLNKA
jgi:hypothetical protein